MEKRNDARTDDTSAKGQASKAPTAPGERGDGPYGDSEPGTPEQHPGV